MSNGLGHFLRQRRGELRISLRAFALRIGMDPSNYSKIERGRARVSDPETLARIADGLELVPGTPERQYFMDLAAVSRGEIPDDVVSNEEIAKALPAFFQRVREEQLADRDALYAAFVSVIKES